VAAASTVDEGLAARRMLDELMAGGLTGCFARVEPRRQARLADSQVRHYTAIPYRVPQPASAAI